MTKLRRLLDWLWPTRELSDGTVVTGLAPAVWLFCWQYERHLRKAD